MYIHRKEIRNVYVYNVRIFNLETGKDQQVSACDF